MYTEKKIDILCISHHTFRLLSFSKTRLRFLVFIINTFCS